MAVDKMPVAPSALERSSSSAVSDSSADTAKKDAERALKATSAKQCAKLKTKLATWANVEHYWKTRNKDYVVESVAKKVILEATRILDVGLKHDSKGNYEYASVKYGEGLQVMRKAMASVSVECVVGKLLANHSEAFSRRKDEIDFFINPKTLDFPTAPSAPPPASSVTVEGMTLV